MKKTVFEEFIRFDKKFDKDKLDFYGDYSPLTEQEKKEFLFEYGQYLKSRYGENFNYEKAVSDTDIQSFLRTFSYSSSNIDFTAYKKQRYSEYKNWQFYTDRVKVSGGEVILSDQRKFPIPSAKFEYGKKLKKAIFKVKIDGEFKRELAEKNVIAGCSGRLVEFRYGCTEVIKLFFAPTGELIYNYARNNKYTYEDKPIGIFNFDEYNDIKIIFNEKSFTIYLNDNDGLEFDYSIDNVPDTLFLASGLQPISDWSFIPVEFITENDEKLDLFIPETISEGEEELIGKVDLPFAIGTKENKDKYLILKGEFDANDDCFYKLSVASLDPGGEIFINGKSAIKKEDFLEFDLYIDEFIKKGKNDIKVVIFPRGPETLYPWHKHDDYYNGWFSNGIKLIKEKVKTSGTLTVKTFNVSSNVTFEVKWNTGIENISGLNYKIKAQKSYPKMEDELVLIRGKLESATILNRFSLPFDKWGVNAPNLYNITVEILDTNDNLLAQNSTETGFRTIEQTKGAIYLNNEKIVLKGALSMQFLPPYNNVPISHVCPTTEQIIEQGLAIKSFNGNCLRMHQLGYGCNDNRFANVFDKLGVMLIWVTRLIDSAENTAWGGKWYQKAEYQWQMQKVINHPSIIMWEGANEYHTNLKGLDNLYDEVVSGIKEIDDTRIISPVSHLYYGGGIYDMGCSYYNNGGTKDENLNSAKSSFGWVDDSVIRSAHTYSLLLGYGCPWKDMRLQDWRLQPELFNANDKAYMVSEYAVIGAQNPNTKEAKEFINKASYELPNDKSALGFNFTEDEWELSQAFQSICAKVATKQLIKNGADGMLWCCLSSGANNGSYLKPILDFYGYKKMAYYSLKELFEDGVAFGKDVDVLIPNDYKFNPFVSVSDYTKLLIEVVDKDGQVIYETKMDKGELSEFTVPFDKNGYYVIRYTTIKE